MKNNTAFAEKWISDIISNSNGSQDSKDKTNHKSGKKKRESNYLQATIQDLIDAGKKGNLCIDVENSDIQKELIMELEKLPSGSLIREGDYIYFQKTWQAKTDLENRFQRLIEYTKDYREKYFNRYSDEKIEEIIKKIEKRWNEKLTKTGESKPEKPFALNEEQRQAILSSVRSPFHIITGGPGTGKTTVVAFLMEVLNELTDSRGQKELPDIEDIALAAPTGRAGQRLTESIQANWKSMDSKIAGYSDIKGTTIHRLLRYQIHNQKFYYNKDRSFLHRLVLVDEVSMVDIFLFQSLLQAIPETDGDREHLPFRFILLGDPNQLPSVEKGAVFRDILGEIEKYMKDNPSLSSILLTKLSKSNRHNSKEGDKILGLANSILSNETSNRNPEPIPDLSEFWIDFEKEIIKKESNLSPIQIDFQIRDEACKHLWEKVFQPQIKEIIDTNLWKDKKTGSDNTEQFVKGQKSNVVYIGNLPDEKTFSQWTTQKKCLTLYRRGSFGIEGLQSLIDKNVRRYLNHSTNKEIPRVILNKRLYYPGLPIIISKNDSIRKLFNGDIGFVLLHGRELRACFLIDGKIRPFALDTLPEHEEAYFLTVHKSQGSEYENLYFYIPPVRGKGKTNGGDGIDNSENSDNSDDTDATEDNGLANKQILYTGITRAKKRLEIFGSKDGWKLGIENSQLRLTGFRL